MNRLLIPFVLFAVLALSGCGSGGNGEEKEPEAEAEVRVVTVQPTALQPALQLVGTLAPLPERTVVLSPAITGQVNQIVAHEGQKVRAGDLLLTLDSRTHESDLAKAQAALSEAEANLAMLKHGAQPEEIEATRQEAHSAAATAEAQRAKLKALEALHAKGEISDVQYEEAKSAAVEAEAGGKAAQQRLKLISTGTRAEMIAQAEAKLAGAKADAGAQQLAVNQCAITSPIDGVVAELPARLGMFVDQPTVLIRIVDDSVLFASVRLPLKALGKVQTGAEATVTLDALPDQPFAGKVERIRNEASAQTGDIDAFVAVENPNGVLKSGLSCNVEIKLPTIENALAVPVPAVADHDGQAVVTLIKDGKAHETEVETGVRTRDAVQIVKGISAGDVVAIEGGYGLPDDCPVKIVTGEEAEDKEKPAGDQPEKKATETEQTEKGPAEK